MIVFFLDVDGVLNSWRSLKKAYEGERKPHSGLNYPFEEEAFINLQELIKETNGYIVICSTWLRVKGGYERVLEELKKYDLHECVIGACDVGYDPIMHRENIVNYVKTLGNNINYIVFDDGYIPNLEEFIKVDIKVGLSKDDILKAKEKIKLKEKKLERLKNG